ncbi:AraC family transcriptional regulator [Paenibacillus sp. UNC451MF]|uniref:AraC family transcriptional regulator n=1 Tax=Paenibacillus sp. UNC451MF TaxID=1449063 RepID=UPI00055B7E4C|nr:AraC family transcriptional regulator [Paenibacillus sp. UNC451MF]
MGSRPFEFDYQRTSAIAFKEVFHAHLQMEFTYVHEGKGNLIIEGKSYSVEPGTLMIFQPFQLHRVQVHVTPEHPFVRSLIMFDPLLLQPYWDNFPQLKHYFQSLKQQQAGGRPLHHLKESDPLVSLMKQFHEVNHSLSPHEHQEEYMFFLLSFLKQLQRIQRQPEGSFTHSSKFSHRAEEVMQWIERHYHEPFRLEKLASELHVSRYHIAHLFKEATGTTILAYVHATRIRHACVWLTKTSLTIPEIAVRAGIPNPSYFCKIFRETMGITPHQYRLQIQKN